MLKSPSLRHLTRKIHHKKLTIPKKMKKHNLKNLTTPNLKKRLNPKSHPMR